MIVYFTDIFALETTVHFLVKKRYIYLASIQIILPIIWFKNYISLFNEIN